MKYLIYIIGGIVVVGGVYLSIPTPSKAEDYSFLKGIVRRTRPVADVKSSDVSLDKYLEGLKEQDRSLIDPPQMCNEGYMESSESGEFEGKIDFYCITYTQGCQDMNNNDPNIIGTKDSNGKINCNCISGYTWSENQCITYTQNCQNGYGPGSYGDEEYCYCSQGYEFDADKTACCVKKSEIVKGKQQIIKQLQEQIIYIISQIIMLQKQLLLLLSN